MVPILLIVGEITPKTLAIRNRVAFASFESRPIEIFSRMITPLRWIIRHVSDFFITLMIGKERSRGNRLNNHAFLFTINIVTILSVFCMQEIS